MIHLTPVLRELKELLPEVEGTFQACHRYLVLQVPAETLLSQDACEEPRGADVCSELAISWWRATSCSK